MKHKNFSLRLIALALVVLLLNGCGAPPAVPAATPALSETEGPALSETEGPALSVTEEPALSVTEEPALSVTEGPALSQAEAEIVTLDSLELVDNYPLYTMQYYGSYSQRASYMRAESPTWGCSLFAALGDADNLLYGRNFDWEYSPALLLFTDPPDGYASVSMVDIAYLGFERERASTLLDLALDERRSLLNAPFLPFDGMNERGLAVGMAAVSPGDMQPDPNKETVDSLMVIRLMLDHASDVDEAVAIMQSYNVDMAGGPPIHYLIADSSGRAVLVEFYQGEMVVIPNEADYHLATNFLRASVGESAEDQCWRYDKIGQRLAETEGRITTQEALDLLDQVSQRVTQWSVVYETSTGNVNVVMGREYDDAHVLNLRLETDE